jgi:hypothetical protein
MLKKYNHTKNHDNKGHCRGVDSAFVLVQTNKTPQKHIVSQISKMVFLPRTDI